MDIPKDIMDSLNKNKTTVVLSSWQINSKKLVEQFKAMGYDVIEESKMPTTKDK